MIQSSVSELKRSRSLFTQWFISSTGLTFKQLEQSLQCTHRLYKAKRDCTPKKSDASSALKAVYVNVLIEKISSYQQSR